MDVYYAMTNYHLLSSLLHKIVYNNNESIIILSSFLVDNQPYLVSNIKKSELFKDVIIFEEKDIDSSIENFNQENENKELERLNEYVERKIGKIIKSANNLYICSDFYAIGFYLIKNKIKYNYFEDGCGILSKKYMPLSIIEKSNKNRAKIVKKLKSFGENDCVINRFGSLKEQEKNYSNKKDIDFSVKDLLKGLSNININKILKIYEVNKINIKDKKAVLLLTMHYNELMDIDEQKNIYTSLMDYFADDNQKIIIKPHPADTINDYDKIFKGSKIINRYMPSELFPYCINNTFEKGVTCWSTSICNLKSILKKIVKFDTRIDQTYKDFDKYYAIVELLKKIKTDKKINIIYKNINEIQLEQLIENYIKGYKKYFTFNENEKNSIYIVDKIDEKLKKEKVISLEYDLNATELIHITKKSPKNEDDMFISLYNMKNVEKIYIKKHLKYSNTDILINTINDNEYKEILYYVIKNQNKSIEKIINKYEKEALMLEEKIELQNSNLNNIYNSTSWKVTVPLRKIADTIRKIKKH